MEYLIDFLITFPADMPAERRTELLTAEADAVAELAERGHALRVWRPLETADAEAGDDPPLHVIGLYVAADDAGVRVFTLQLGDDGGRQVAGHGIVAENAGIDMQNGLGHGLPLEWLIPIQDGAKPRWR